MVQGVRQVPGDGRWDQGQGSQDLLPKVGRVPGRDLPVLEEKRKVGFGLRRSHTKGLSVGQDLSPCAKGLLRSFVERSLLTFVGVGLDDRLRSRGGGEVRRGPRRLGVKRS